ncbi:MAG: ribonuclease J [Oscillospiraceae bacterium]
MAKNDTEYKINDFGEKIAVKQDSKRPELPPRGQSPDTFVPKNSFNGRSFTQYDRSPRQPAYRETSSNKYQNNNNNKRSYQQNYSTFGNSSGNRDNSFARDNNNSSNNNNTAPANTGRGSFGNNNDNNRQNSLRRSYRQKPYTRRSYPQNRASDNAAEQSKYLPADSSFDNSPAEAKLPGDQNGYRSNHRDVKRTPLKIIPLGGLHEIGKNMTVFECANDIFIVDCGMAFPDSDMPGVDIVLPDFSYIEENADRVRGVVITHGHEDHIGGLPYLLKKINVPVYATRLTVGLIENKLKEHNLMNSVDLNVVKPRQTVKFGCMAVEFIRVNHSIPDAVALAIHTPAGIVVHTGDFKVDYTPIEGGVIDLARFSELGSRGVLALMADSTNAERPGHTASERTVGASFEKLFDRADGKRIIIATFSSNIQRIQQIVNHAVRCGRKVAVSGRSMENVISTATELGYLKVPEGVLIGLEEINRLPPEKIVLITTGSQGEPMSALTRMAMSEHRSVTITPMDLIIISATPIPGNEKLVTKVVNELMKSGAEVVYEAMYDVHVSGHACQEELKLMQALTKPKFFIPVHGEYKHLKKHAGVALSMGMSEDSVIIGTNGDVIETDGVTMRVTGAVHAGRVLVDGLGVGDVGSIVLRDRKHLAEDGLIVVVVTIESESGTILAGPDIVSRGFVYVRESEEMMDAARQLLTQTLTRCLDSNIRDWNTIKSRIKDDLSDYIFIKTKRSPMILPVIEEV